MNTGGEAAEQVVRMSMQTGEMALRITGQAAKHLAVMLYAILKDQKKTKGRVRLESMCRNSRELKVFTVGREDVKTFVQKAKDYGMLYCAVRGKKDGMVDFLVRAEDAPKADRIVERFNLTSVEEKKDTELKIVKERQKHPGKMKKREEMGGHDKEEALLNELLGKTEHQEKSKNPTRAKTGRSRPSEPISGTQRKDRKDIIERGKEERRPSVRKELREIGAARAEREKTGAQRKQERAVIQHKQPKRRKSQKVR